MKDDNYRQNFFCVDNRIFDLGLKPREIAVYCCICRHINSQSGVAFPSRKTIAKECGIGKVDTVDKALKILCESRLIHKCRQYLLNGGCSSNIYSLSPIRG